MKNPSTVLLLPNFSSLNDKKQLEFLYELDDVSRPGTVVLVDCGEISGFDNIKLVKFSHGKDVGDTLRTGLAAAVGMGAENVVMFEDYSRQNASWFLKYLDSGNVMESGRRGIPQMIATEVSNLFSFGNLYNGFSMNRVLTREAATALKDTRRHGRAFLIEAANSLNSRGIRTVEVVKKTRKRTAISMRPREIFESVVQSFNHSSILFSIFGSLAYVANLITVYLSLSLGWFYPLAILLGGEISAFSNFVMNEKVNFRNRGFFRSAYRFGKFNAIALMPVLADIVLIGYLARYTAVIGKSMFLGLSVVTVVFMSVVSLFLVTRFVWSKGNNTTIKI